MALEEKSKVWSDKKMVSSDSSRCAPDQPANSDHAPVDWEARCRRVELLYQVSEAVHANLDPQEALQNVMREVVRISGASSGCIALLNPTTGFLEIEVAHGLPAKVLDLKLKVGEGVTGWVARTGKTLRISDVRSDPRYLMLRRNVRSELAIPLISMGNLLGVLNVESSELDAFSSETQILLEHIAPLAAQVICNTWRFEQLRLRARLYEALVNVSRTINSSLELDEVLQAITRDACKLMNAKMGSLLMLDDSREWLNLRASHGAGTAYLGKPRLSVSDSLVGVVVRRKKPIQVENVQISGGYHNVEIARQEGLISLLSVPLVFEHRAIGALNVYTQMPHSFSNEEIRVLSALADLSAIAIEKAQLYERIVGIEDQLRQSEKLSAVGLLAAEVAHEIRNPLTVLKMLYHSLNLDFAPEDPRTRDFQIMGQKMDHMNKIVEQVLDFARRTEPQMAPVDLNRLIEDLGLLSRHKLNQHNILFERVLAPDLPLVQADSTQLEQAFLNLILNAVEAMPNGGQLRIRTRGLRVPPTAPDYVYVLIEFKDTGHGMLPEQRDKLMSSLLQTTKRTGTGLGMAIVAKVIDAHQGKVHIKSAPGTGTTFRITLPVS
jgi:signal transduction histidine kinase